MSTSPTPLFPSLYCPPIAYFTQIAKYESIVIEQYETFPKQTFRNRAIILTANGLLPLSVPAVRTHGNHTMTRDIGISYAEHWNIRHWRAIESAYNASPYFLYYRDGIEQIIMSPHERLIDLNDQILQYCMKKLKIATQVSYSKDFVPTQSTNDFRQDFSPKHIYDTISFPEYDQVFATRYPFQPNLSILDLLFNMGPDAKNYLLKCTIG